MVTAIDLLVAGDYLYPMSEGLPIFRDGEVAIRDGRIVYAGPRKPAEHWQPARVLGGGGRAILPGLINCHCHAASLIFRSLTDEGSVGKALYGLAFRLEKYIGDEEWAELAALAVADMLRAGITTLNDVWYHPAGLAVAVEQAGLRANIAEKVFDVRLENLHEGDYTRYPADGERRLRAAVEFAQAWHGAADGRITARIATHATDTCGPELHQAARAEADRLGLGMQIHAAQAPSEVARVRAEQGCGPLVYLRDLGYLRDDVVVAHLTFADANDLDAVMETGAGYAHCPTIYPRRGVYPPLWDIRARGIRTGFATDWMLNDPFEGMRNAMQACRTLREDPASLLSAEALWHHTLGGAQALSLEDEIGSLEPGKKADIVILNLEKPHLQPFYGGYPALVFYAKASDVETVLVDGRVVVEQGRPTHLDEGAALAAVKSRLPGWIDMVQTLDADSLPPFHGPCHGV